MRKRERGGGRERDMLLKSTVREIMRKRRKRKTVIESEINVFYFFFMKLRRNILVRKKIYTKV